LSIGALIILNNISLGAISFGLVILAAVLLLIVFYWIVFKIRKKVGDIRSDNNIYDSDLLELMEIKNSYSLTDPIYQIADIRMRQLQQGQDKLVDELAENIAHNRYQIAKKQVEFYFDKYPKIGFLSDPTQLLLKLFNEKEGVVYSEYGGWLFADHENSKTIMLDAVGMVLSQKDDDIDNTDNESGEENLDKTESGK
jgi:hypothetical protein